MLTRPISFIGLGDTPGGGASDPPTINGSESIIGIDSAVSGHTVSLASQTFTPGDYLLAVASLRRVTVNSLAGATDDTYALIRGDSSAAATFSRLELHEGTVVSGLDASIDYTLSAQSRFAGGLLTFSGAGASQPNISGSGIGLDASPVSPSVTTTVDNCLVLSIFSALGGHDLSVLEAAVPAGYTFLKAVKSTVNIVPTNNFHATLAIAHKVQVTAGSVAAATWSSALGGSMEWVADHIALEPA